MDSIELRMLSNAEEFWGEVVVWFGEEDALESDVEDSGEDVLVWSGDDSLSSKVEESVWSAVSSGEVVGLSDWGLPDGRNSIVSSNVFEELFSVSCGVAEIV